MRRLILFAALLASNGCAGPSKPRLLQLLRECRTAQRADVDIIKDYEKVYGDCQKDLCLERGGTNSACVYEAPSHRGVGDFSGGGF